MILCLLVRSWPGQDVLGGGVFVPVLACCELRSLYALCCTLLGPAL